MITLAFLNFIINLINNLIFFIFGNTVLPILNSVSSFIDGISVPQTFYDIISLAVYFLPMGTVITLFNLTLVVILGKMVLSIIHLFSGGLLFGQ